MAFWFSTKLIIPPSATLVLMRYEGEIEDCLGYCLFRDKGIITWYGYYGRPMLKPQYWSIQSNGNS